VTAYARSVSGQRIEPGVRLSGHVISEEIGTGGFSKVFRAEPLDGSAAVAIKFAIRPELVSALRTEGAVLRKLQGPRFVRVLEEHLEEDPPYFVLELCEKGDLRAHLERVGGRLPPAEVERLLIGILEGCAFAHDEGVVHGDLKPENVLLDARGEPKIADLGLSRAHRRRLVVGDGVEQSQGTEAVRVRGTFDYLAPETRKGGDITPASDVFALGVLAYELLTGTRPLGVFLLPRAVLAREGIEVPRALDRLVERALAHDASARYPDASFMLADLRAGDAGVTWDAAPTGVANAPRLARVDPVNDLVFTIHLYGAFVFPIVIFGLVATTLRFHVERQSPVRIVVVATAAVLLALAMVRVVRRERRT
jgi:serine/threonine-protein kinase